MKESSGTTIDGLPTISTSVPFQGWIIIFDGTNWGVIGYILKIKEEGQLRVKHSI